jgi:hypothetical protein
MHVCYVVFYLHWRMGRAPMVYYPEFARAVVEAIEEMM